ncbi:MAG: hypothetical protein RIT81_34850 [Deltaproteobacteria bacterium]
MIAWLVLAASLGGGGDVVDVPKDRFVSGCAGLEMQSRRNPLTVECRVRGGGVELVIDDGDIDALALRAKRWPPQIRVVLRAWRFENVQAYVAPSKGEPRSIRLTNGESDDLIVKGLGRTTKKVGERKISDDVVIPEHVVTVIFEVDGSALAPGDSLRVSWIDAYRR